MALVRSTPSGPPKLDMTCPVCGRPIDVIEGGWRESEALVHTGCVDWAKRPFPFDWELDRLRRLSRLLRRTVRAVDDAGVWLAAVKRDWPRNAGVRLAQWGAKRARLDEELRELLERLGK